MGETLPLPGTKTIHDINNIDEEILIPILQEILITIFLLNQFQGKVYYTGKLPFRAS